MSTMLTCLYGRDSEMGQKQAVFSHIEFEQPGCIPSVFL